MEDHKNKDQKKRPDAKVVWRLFLAIIGVIAIVQQLRKPAGERTWNGKVAGLIPYDFRPPTIERFRETYWNPDGPVIASKAWGVGWAPNLGAAKRLFGN